MNFKWLIKQLVPLNYESVFRNSENKKCRCNWKMWLGKPFDINFSIA